MNKGLLIWEEIPGTTSFHIIDFEPVYEAIHGKYIGLGITEEEAELINFLDAVKGPPVDSLKLPTAIEYFVQTGRYVA